MKFISYFIENRIVTLVLTTILVGLGAMFYQDMSRLEDPEFTIKDALVVTAYPGASAIEVEEEVTDRLEKAVQQLGQIDRVESRSERGLSTLTVSIRDSYDKETLPQVWDELRRKVNDVQSDLPPGVYPSVVVDDFGDVYGVYFVVYGDEYTPAELKQVVDMLERELLLVKDVAKIEILGASQEAVYVEIDKNRMAQLGISPSVVINALQSKNIIQDSGRVEVGQEYLALNPTGEVNTIEEFSDIPISVGGKQFSLRDIATVRRGYAEPSDTIVRFNGHRGIAMGISTRSGGNVVTMGTALDERLEELQKDIPLGIELGMISVQSEAVTEAINNFIVSLIEAILIVIAVLLVFMGLRSGFLIGFVLLITILGSFIFLNLMDVALERVSLGALIIALGMLVDNAIVIVDGMLIRISKGEDKKSAAIKVVSQTAIPLLMATAIAILAFAAIGTSDDSTGEFCRSLFQVILVSLSLSWVTAVTITPLLGILVLSDKKPKNKDSTNSDPYDTAFYKMYRRFLALCIRFRWLTVAAVVVMFIISILGFGNVKNSFFPPSTRDQFLVDVWLPQGSSINETAERSAALEKIIMEEEGVSAVSSVVGQGALRFVLTYGPTLPNSAYSLLLVDVDDPSIIDGLIKKIDGDLNDRFPEAEIYGYKFALGPGSIGKLEPRFYGNDPVVLRSLADKAEKILRSDPGIKAIHTNWRQPTKVIRPLIIEEQANLLGISRPDIAKAIKQGFSGLRAGVYREHDLLLPIYLKAKSEESSDISNLANLQVWSPVAQKSVSLVQLLEGEEIVFENEIVYRRDRRRQISIYGDPIDETADEVLSRIRPQIESIELPTGYSLEWGGEFEDTTKAKSALASSVPIFLGMMILMTIVLFNSLRQPLVIWLCVPLIIVGVTAGLLLFDQPFSFMAILGFLSLIGMLIKNAIVLVDEINEQQRLGEDPLSAVLNSGTSRLRPVAMAAATTALGMLPLLTDAFFIAMAITIIAGLIVGTILTMVIVPVFYTLFFRIPNKS